MHKLDLFKKIHFLKGFSLLEVIIYVAIVFLIVFLVIQFIITGSSVQLQSRIYRDLRNNAWLATERIYQVAKNAVDIQSPMQGASSTSVIFTMPVGIASPIIFDVDSGSLRIKEGVGSAYAITDSKITVTGPVFTNLNDGSGKNIRVQMNFVTGVGNSLNNATYTLDTAMGLRPN